MAHLIVVGAGLAGSALTRIASSVGHSVTLVSDTQPSTTAAIALLRSGHLPAEDRPMLAPSLAAWEELGVEVVRGGSVTSYRKPGAEAARQADWYGVDPSSVLLEPDVRSTVTTAPVPTSVVVADGELSGDAVVWCTGTGLGRRTYGHTWLHDDPTALRQPPGTLRLHHIAPYKVLAGVTYRSGARLGSSSASTLAAARTQAQSLMEKALNLGWLSTTDGWHLVSGTRLQREPGERLRRSPLGAGAWHWSGFHRTGFGVVPIEAQRVLSTVLAELRVSA